MATATLPSSPSIPQFAITSEEISRYAELTSLLTQLEKQKDELRAELLELYADGAEQEETGPYLLALDDAAVRGRGGASIARLGRSRYSAPEQEKKGVAPN